eukprot:g5151.t1
MATKVVSRIMARGGAMRECPRRLYYGYDPLINPEPEGAPWLRQTRVEWNKSSTTFESIDSWLSERKQSMEDISSQFERSGFAVVRGVCGEDTLGVYRAMHDDMHVGKIATPGRHDLGSHKERSVSKKENVTQIMWPTDLVESSREGPIHRIAYELSQRLIGKDASFDFDMLIYKEPKTETETPWHQDEAYWPSGIEDKRAITMWTALDDTIADNGAMWYVAGSHRGELRDHRPAGANSHILMCDGVDESTPGATCVELRAGDAVLWTGRTLHYSRGNSTEKSRRTFIVNFRPHQMVRWERQNGFDHLRKGFDDYDAQIEKSGDAYRRAAGT